MKRHNTEHLPYTSKSASTSEYIKTSIVKVWWLYMADWVTAIVVVTIAQLIYIPKSHSVRFSATDPSIQQQHRDDHGDVNKLCVVLMTAVPVVVMLGWLGYYRRPVYEFHHAVLGLACAMSFCVLFTSIFKQIGYQLSPDFLERCSPRADRFRQALHSGTPLSFHDCTHRDAESGLTEYPDVSITRKSFQHMHMRLYT
ncbi:hypothetical protein GGI12_001977 [Dipsacomyces acuminosporus]|nr:hypothetical protein GGI12_001977 [Dipsacomyces acuminosporus]